MSQNLQNHRRYSIGWHIVTTLFVLALFITSIVYFVNGLPSVELPRVMFLLIGCMVVSFFIHIRMFPLKAQDRAIRAEENLRHLALTGRLLHPDLRMGQIIALRFASDAEFPALAEKAAHEKLSSKQIKQSIKAWRPDYYRV